MAQQPSQAPGSGPGASLRALGTTLLEVVGTRAELAAVELREESERHKQAIALTAIAAIFLAMGVLLATLFVIVLFWDTYRLTALGVGALLYLAIAAYAYLRLRRNARTAPPPFEATLRELAADRDMLRGHGE